MKVSFISLGCAKNLVNTEQMMALCRDAGMELLPDSAGADVVVINTCGFIDSAKSEAIDAFLRGKLKGRTPDRAERKRLSDALLRRGYSWNDIRLALNRLGGEEIEE